MTEREFRWELSSAGRVVGGGRLVEGDRVVLGPTGQRKDSGFVTLPWHVRLTIASGRLLAASADENAPAVVDSSSVPRVFVEIGTPCRMTLGNVEVRVMAVRASASVMTSAPRVTSEDTIVSSPRSLAAQIAPPDLRETRTSAPFAPPRAPSPPHDPDATHPPPTRFGPAEPGPRLPTPFPCGVSAYANASPPAYAPPFAYSPAGTPPNGTPHASVYATFSPAPAHAALPVPSASVSLPPTPPAPAAQKPRLAILALGGACLLFAAGLFVVRGAATNAPARSAKRPATAAAAPSPPITAAAALPSATAAESLTAKAPAPPATGVPGSHASPLPRATTAARTPIERRDVLAERRIAKALLTGDAIGATTAADALAAAHPEIAEYRTMRRALRRMAEPSSAD